MVCVGVVGLMEKCMEGTQRQIHTHGGGMWKASLSYAFHADLFVLRCYAHNRLNQSLYIYEHNRTGGNELLFKTKLENHQCKTC